MNLTTFVLLVVYRPSEHDTSSYNTDMYHSKKKKKKKMEHPKLLISVSAAFRIQLEISLKVINTPAPRSYSLRHSMFCFSVFGIICRYHGNKHSATVPKCVLDIYGTAKKKRPGYLVGNLVATNWPIEKPLHAIGYNQIPTK